jgi:Tol biopolymer transport system component/predicted Ser/Thr protein kinase
MPLSAGDKIGPYEILAPIGAGGMGEVWKAHDPRLNRDVAIKVSAVQFSERFEVEAKAIAALNHPNICQIYDVGPNYLVMEYIEGDAPKGPMPLEEAVRIARQIAGALEAAHEKGITHRDLKPANIKINPDGTVKVLDFGLAKIHSGPASSGEHSPTLTIGMTQAGMILGTAAYMAPEQARGKENVDKRADIWAFGVVLYELLTGKRLFQGEDVGHTLAAVIMQEPDLSCAPAQVVPLLKRCLEKDPKKRLRDIGDMELLLAAGPVATAPTTLSRMPRLGWMWPTAAGLLALAAVALGFVSYRHVSEEPPRVVKVSVLPPEKATLVGNSLPAVSPDGRRLAFVAAMEGKDALWVRDLDSLAARALTGTEGAFDPFWSPDSRSIAFFAGGKLKKIEVAGGPALTLCDAPGGRPRGGSWGKNDVLVFAPNNGNTGILRVSAAGGTSTPVTQPDTASGESSHRFPWFLPDGRHFLYATLASGEKNGVFAGDIDSKSDPKNRQRVLAGNSMAVYAPPGYLLFVRDRTLMAQRLDAANLQTVGDAVPVAEQVDSTSTAAQYQFSVSENGVLAYISGGTTGATQLTWTDRSGKVASAAGPPGVYGDFRLAPDEKRIAFERSDAGNQDVWVMDIARGVTSRLTFDPANDNLPLWSPDGLRILYADNRSGGYDLYVKAATGAGQEEVLVKMGTPNGFGTSWSRDGRFLMYTVRAAGTKTGYDLWIAPQFPERAGGDRKPFPYLQTQFNEFGGAFSPDGRWVAYISDESGRDEIYVQAFPLSGAKFQISTGGGVEPAWRSDGTELFYRSADGNLMAVSVKSGATFETSVPKSLFPLVVPAGGVGRQSYAVTNDGQRFLVAASVGEKSVPLTVVLNWPVALKK